MLHEHLQTDIVRDHRRSALTLRCLSANKQRRHICTHPVELVVVGDGRIDLGQQEASL